MVTVAREGVHAVMNAMLLFISSSQGIERQVKILDFKAQGSIHNLKTLRPQPRIFRFLNSTQPCAQSLTIIWLMLRAVIS